MRVDIKHVEKKQGLLFGTKLYGVECTVVFSDEERQIIEERDLKPVVFMERRAPADVDEEKHESRGLGKKLLTAAVKGRDANSHGLSFNKLLRGADTYFTPSPADAKFYEEDLVEALKTAKKYLEANEETGGSSSFEL